MAKRKSYNLAGVQYPTQKSALEVIRKILHGSELNEPLQGNDLKTITDLLQLHPDAVEKMGPGIESIGVRINHPPGCKPTRGFYIARIDRKDVDFSIYTALKGRRKTPIEDLEVACRSAITNNLHNAKTQHFEEFATDEQKVKCEISGDYCTWLECEIDHVAPFTFQAIVKMWLASTEFVANQPAPKWFRESEHDCHLADFVDADLKQRWIDFHDRVVSNNGSLRIVKRGAHRRLKGQRKPKVNRPLMPPTTSKKAN